MIIARKITCSRSLLLEKAIAAREALFEPGHKSALRLFNGFLEGCPDLVVDLYASDARPAQLCRNHRKRDCRMVQAAQAFLQERLPWLRAGIVKTRNSPTAEEKTRETPVRRGSPTGRCRKTGSGTRSTCA